MGEDFTGKILFIGELIGVERSQAKLRILISEGKLKLLTTVMGEGGEITTQTIETRGVPVFITTTTSVSPDAELLNRLFMLSIDESRAHTREVLRFEAQKFMEPINEEKDIYESELLSIFDTVLTSMKNKYLVPFADILGEVFPDANLKARRDFKKLIAITGAIAILHQFQRPIVFNKKLKEFEYVVALPIDFYMALRISEKSLQSTLMNVQARALEALKVFEAGEFQTASTVSALINRSQSTTRQLLNSLMRQGLLTRDDAKKPYKFFLKEGYSEYTCSLSQFEEVFKVFDENKLKGYLDSKNLDARQESKLDDLFIKTTFDPISGEPMNTDEILAYLSRASEEKQNKEEQKRKQQKLVMHPRFQK